MTKIVTIDFETKDPYIGRGLGSGWVYGIHDPNSDFKVLGASIKINNEPAYYETGLTDILQVVIYQQPEMGNTLIMHNAQYDLGCLLYLIHMEKRNKYNSFDCLINKLRNIDIIDTEVMSRLYNNILPRHDLDSLCRKYLKMKKDNQGLIDLVRKHDLFPYTKKDLASKMKDPNFVRELDDKKLEKFAKINMDLLQETDKEVMAKYANQDVECTYKLFKYLANKLDKELYLKYSKVQKVCAFNRINGIIVDLVKANKISLDLESKVNNLLDTIHCKYGEFNINSTKQVAEKFDEIGISYSITDKGNPSITTPWLKAQEHDLCKRIIEARKYIKIKGDFVDKILDMQQYTCPDASDLGKVYPEMNLLRAVTGRFSCQGPNIQQIPARDPELGPLIRGMFVPNKGTKWYSLDYASQESRLQIHYANKVGCEGASELVLAYNQNPNLDLHTKVAEMAQIERSQAKTINLGLSYGMGQSKLSGSLELTEQQGKLLMEKYHTALPWLGQLSKACMDAMKSRGYIRTLGGRESKIDPPMYINGKRKTFEYRALNKLIQGSAADQIIEAMIQAFDQRLSVIAVIHDQFCLQGSKEDAILLKKIMENCVKLSLPVVADVDLEGGDNWAEAGH